MQTTARLTSLHTVSGCHLRVLMSVRPTLALAYLTAATCSAISTTDPCADAAAHRWVWDATAALSGTDTTYVSPDQKLCIPLHADRRDTQLVLIGPDTAGTVPSSVLRREPLPPPQAVHDYAIAVAQNALAYPHTARFPPFDSIRVIHRGNGHFLVSGSVSAQNSNRDRRTTSWQMFLHRKYSRLAVGSGFIVDSVAFDDGPG